MKPSLVTATLFDSLNYRAERQKVISNNIANINTVDYKTKELSFESELQNKMKERDLELKVTNHAHLKGSNEEMQKSRMNVYEVPNLQEINDGNNVNLDHQMAEMSKNSTIFQALQSSIKKDSSFFRSVIDSSARN